ncbi:MAG TPA: GDSL-type esterase/lipase family protein [Armatimonadota bacterium]|jgi:lysophospholipase L1-like esterase
MNFIEKIARRQADYSAHAPVTMAFLGDSVTHGAFGITEGSAGEWSCLFDPEMVYHAQLRRMLAVLFPAAAPTVVNAGCSGNSAPDGLARLERDVLSAAPDLVVVCFGLNDVACGAGLSAYEAALIGILTTLRERNIATMLLTPNMLNTYVSALTLPALRDFAAQTAELQQSGVMDQFMDCARQLSADLHVPLCDCYAQWTRLHALGVDTTLLLSNYINHPTVALHGLFAQSLYQRLVFGA